MKSVKLSSAVLVVISLLLARVQDPPERKVVLKAGTPVMLVFAQTLSSKYAVVGHQIEFQLGEDLKIDDAIVARKGSRALGVIVEGKEKEDRKHAKFMEIRMDFLRVGDQRVKLGGEHSAKAKVDKEAVWTATILFGLSGYLWARDQKKFVIPEGTPMPAFVSEDIELPVIASVGPQLP